MHTVLSTTQTQNACLTQGILLYYDDYTICLMKSIKFVSYCYLLFIANISNGNVWF